MLSRNLSVLSAEPLVTGKAFYERVSDLVELHNISKIRVTKAIQTNATLIDEKVVRAFQKEQLSLGGENFVLGNIEQSIHSTGNRVRLTGSHLIVKVREHALC